MDSRCAYRFIQLATYGLFDLIGLSAYIGCKFVDINELSLYGWPSFSPL